MWPFSTIRNLRQQLDNLAAQRQLALRDLEAVHAALQERNLEFSELRFRFKDLQVKNGLLSDMVKHHDDEIARLKSELAIIRVRRDPKTGRLVRAKSDV